MGSLAAAILPYGGMDLATAALGLQPDAPKLCHAIGAVQRAVRHDIEKLLMLIGHVCILLLGSCHGMLRMHASLQGVCVCGSLCVQEPLGSCYMGACRRGRPGHACIGTSWY